MRLLGVKITPTKVLWCVKIDSVRVVTTDWKHLPKAVKDYLQTNGYVSTVERMQGELFSKPEQTAQTPQTEQAQQQPTQTPQ